MDALKKKSSSPKWVALYPAFNEWIENKQNLLKPGLSPEPTVKVLIFLALIDANKPCTYIQIREIFKIKKIINGVIPDNTLRTSILNLAKTLDKYNHSLELSSSRGKFQLIPRIRSHSLLPSSGLHKVEPVLLLLEPLAIKAEDLAYELVEKARLPFNALYFLEWSARWWEIFSHNESQIRVQYECDAWEKLGIKDRLLVNLYECISFVGLAPGEGLAEIELLKKILVENPEKKIHYLAVDSSQRLLRQHINLLKEALAESISKGRVIVVGVIADIFSNFHSVLTRVKDELVNKAVINHPNDFLPALSSMLITYFGNCLGNYYQDQENEIFSIMHSTFQNRPLEFLIGVSVMRDRPDEYKRNWDEFLLQTPKHLLETNKLLESLETPMNGYLREFSLPETGNSTRCPPVVPETYIVRHGIEGHIYRFYYRLAYDLALSSCVDKSLRPLPKGSLILLYNIVKYNMVSLIKGLETCGLFKIKYDPQYHQMVDTPNGKREYAVFSAFLDK